MKKWEYMFETWFATIHDTPYLNVLGDQGWEVVTVFYCPHQEHHYIIFKRELL